MLTADAVLAGEEPLAAEAAEADAADARCEEDKLAAKPVTGLDDRLAAKSEDVSAGEELLAAETVRG